MKPFLLIPILCCLFVSLSHATITFNGQVMDAKTALPVQGIYIYVQDSLATSAATRVKTTVTGQYSITWPGTATLGARFKVWTAPACGFVQQSSVTYTGNATITTNFNVCQGSLNYVLQGKVNLGGTSNTGLSTVEVFGVGPDSLGDSVIIFHDSFNTTTGTGGAFIKGYQSMPVGKLYLKATLQNTHPAYGSFFPTYANSAQSWLLATPLTNAAFISDTTTIGMINTSSSSGPGYIGGHAISGGQPAKGRIIILTTSNNAALNFTYTDSLGAFSFNNLALGTYKVHGDVMPKLNPALTMTLTSTKPSIPNLLFEESQKTFIARLAPLGVSSATGNGLDGLMPAPNPTQRELRISGAERIEGAKQLIVRDLSGRVISSTDFASGQNVTISAADWATGMYFLQLQTSIGSQTYRISKQ